MLLSRGTIPIFILALAVALAAGTLLLIASGLRDDIAPSDLGLVLGNKIEADGRPSLRLRARLDETVELYRAGDFPLILVSGGIGKEGFDEATVMRRYLIEAGVPAARILADNQGATTFASAKNARRILEERGLKSVLVVSQYFHVPRSRLALRRFGVATVHSAHARYFDWRDLYSAPRELLAFLYYFFRSYPTGPRDLI
jgi:vancomycin permeability regulator SanA